MKNKKIFDFKSFSLKDKILTLSALIVLGLLLVSFSSPKAETQPSENTDVRQYTVSDYKKNLEQQLKNTLENVVGVGDVEIMITLDGEVSQTIAYNEKTSANGVNDDSKRTSQTSVTKDAVMVKDSGGTSPYSTGATYPDVVGVVVVAQGANNSVVKSYIIDAVKASLNVSSHKIVVLPKKND